jgi:hypothetical protein
MQGSPGGFGKSGVLKVDVKASENTVYEYINRLKMAKQGKKA